MEGNIVKLCKSFPVIEIPSITLLWHPVFVRTFMGIPVHIFWFYLLFQNITNSTGWGLK